MEKDRGGKEMKKYPVTIAVIIIIIGIIGMTLFAEGAERSFTWTASECNYYVCRGVNSAGSSSDSNMINDCPTSYEICFGKDPADTSTWTCINVGNNTNAIITVPDTTDPLEFKGN